jgi:hypothetical protein
VGGNGAQGLRRGERARVRQADAVAERRTHQTLVGEGTCRMPHGADELLD